MSDRLVLEAPTFTSLNKSQKRALILRDQLRYVEPVHLNTFIEGITDDEPPTYIKINGVIKPELASVRLKDEATRFDLGNVILEQEGNKIHRVYLVVDSGQIEMRAEDSIPLDDNVFDSVPIHGFIARPMVEMFKQKYLAIFTRVNKINEARRAAFNMPHLPPVMFHDGETLARLDPPTAEPDNNQVTSRSRKREPNEEVTQHVSNKRKRTGLDTISEDAKSKTFDTIPNHVKVDLFNSIVKTAFPNFDNLMMASWNVVSIYQGCGSDFPELHRSIVELKGVLQDFDEATGERVDRKTPTYRYDFSGPSQDGVNGDGSNRGPANGNCHNGGLVNEDRLITAPPTQTQNGADAPSQANGSAANANQNEIVQQQDEHDSTVDLFGGREERVEPEMPPPRLMQLTQPQETPAEEEEDDDSEDEVPAVDPRSKGRHDRQSSAHQPSPPHTVDIRMDGSVPSSSETSPEPQQTRTPRHRVTIAEKRDAITSDAPPTSPGLVRRRKEYASSIGKASALANLRAATPVQPNDTDSHSEHDRPAPPLHDQPPKPKPTLRKKKMSDLTTEHIRAKLVERKAELLRTFLTMDQIPEQKMTQLQQLQSALEAREKNKISEEKESSRDNGMFGASLGNSVLGAKKPMGVAPVAPMFPMGAKRDGYMASDWERGGRGGGEPPNGRRH